MLYDCLYLFIGLVIVLYFKWILIVLILPFQCVYGQILRRYDKYHLPMICKLAVAPFWLWERLFRNGWGRYMVFQIGMLPSCHLRRHIYKMIGSSIDRFSVFHYGTEIRYPYYLKVGQGTIIGDRAILDARNGLTIGKNVNLSSNVSIYTEQHDYRDPLFRCIDPSHKSVTICDRVWLGSNVVVLPGVTIGEGAVCCAGCVVTKDVEPYTVVAGVPASKINERPRNLIYEFHGNSCRLY